MNPTPRGLFTSEFWITLLGLALTALVQAGVLKPADVQTIEGPSNGAITNLVAAAGQILLVYRYLSSRTQIKLEALQALPPAPSAPTDNPKLAA